MSRPLSHFEVEALRERIYVAERRRDGAFRHLESFVKDVLKHHFRHEWSLQGFGMLRMYLSKPGDEGSFLARDPRDAGSRLHVWDSRYRISNVTLIHDHPWDFESLVLSGRIRNVVYRVDADAGDGEIATHVQGCIFCGAKPPVTGASRETPVRLTVKREETFGPGATYALKADEIHSSHPEDGTVTICRRFKTDKNPDHALVYWPLGGSFVAGHPRAATVEEVKEITGRALDRWGTTPMPHGPSSQSATAGLAWAPKTKEETKDGAR